MSKLSNFNRVTATTLVLLAGRLGWCPMISFSTLSLPQGFNFKSDVQSSFGIIQTLKFGNTVITPDITCNLPVTADGNPAKSQAAGVMSSFSWAGGVGDPLNLKFNVSTATRNKLVALINAQSAVSPVVFSLAIFQFDPISNKFYLGLTNNAKFTGTLQGTVVKQSSKLLLSVASTPSDAVLSPQNWAVQLSISPTTAQTITYQVSSGNKLVKPWGITL